MKWQILSSEYLFSDLWFKVRKDVCKTPQGKIVDPYYVYEFTEWVAAVPVTEDGKIVMIKQYRHGLGETCIEFPEVVWMIRMQILKKLLKESWWKKPAIHFLLINTSVKYLLILLPIIISCTCSWQQVVKKHPGNHWIIMKK